MAQAKDRALMDFLAIDIDTVITRKGFIDVTELHRRWDCKLTLLKNGRPFSLEHPAGTTEPVIGNVDRFTWIMMLVESALDAAMGNGQIQEIVTNFLTKVFEESPNGTEYLQCDVYQHLQGWRSSACVRGILNKARAVWSDLESRGEHWPGFIPSTENREILQMLLWLTTGHDPEFRTASSDVYCLSIVLQAIGIKLVPTTDSLYEAHESILYVIYDTRLASRQVRTNKSPRWGMRIPLRFMKECVSIWPDSQSANNDLRRIFEDGMDAVNEENFQPRFMLNSTPGQEKYILRGSGSYRKNRLESLENRVGFVFLPFDSYESAIKLGAVVRKWTKADQASFDSFLRRSPSTDSVSELGGQISEAALAQLQAFLLGFYYQLLLPLVDFSSLSRAEAYGSWAYRDVSFLERVLKFAKVSREGSGFINRLVMLCFIAYMFAGAGLEGIENAVVQSTGCVGVLAKLSLLTWACLGSVPTLQEAGQFHLLDIDTTFIPSTNSGLVIQGSKQRIDAMKIIQEYADGSQASTLAFESPYADFTAHIEPDWENDVQACLVVYRHKGRLVHRIQPSSLEQGLQILHDYSEFVENAPINPKRIAVGHLATLQVDSSHGGSIIQPSDKDAGLLICMWGLPLARTCILGMYSGYDSSRGRTGIGRFSFVQVSSPEALSKALQVGRNYVIAAERSPKDRSVLR